MSEEKVSKSQTGQDMPPPSREERDAAFSSGGGREAVEEPVMTERDLPVGAQLELTAHEFLETEPLAESSQSNVDNVADRPDEEWSERMYTSEEKMDEGGLHPQSPPGNSAASDQLPKDRPD